MRAHPSSGSGPAALAPDEHVLLAFVSPVYEDVALNELRDITGARFVRALARGTLLVGTAQEAGQTAERLAARPPVFVRQLLTDVRAVARTDDVDADARAIADLCPGAPIVCDLDGRCHAPLRALARAVSLCHCDAAAAQPYLVVAAPGEHLVGAAQPGAGIAGAPFWPAGRPALPSEPRFVSRSALKLHEAVGLYSIPLIAGRAALDLGAAPGGWSQMLARHGMWVTAVDPGELDPRVLGVQNVRAFRDTAQEFVQTGVGQFDMVVDDMRVDARESARLLLALRPKLRRGAIAVLTLKLPERAPSAVLRSALATLDAGYTILGVRSLYYNRHEVTVYARLRTPRPA